MESWIYQLPVAIVTLLASIVGIAITYGKLSARIEHMGDEIRKNKEDGDKVAQKVDAMRDEVRGIESQRALDAQEVKHTLATMNTMLQTGLSNIERQFETMALKIEDTNTQVEALYRQEHSHAAQVRERMTGIQTSLAVVQGIFQAQGFHIPSPDLVKPEILPQSDLLRQPLPTPTGSVPNQRARRGG